MPWEFFAPLARPTHTDAVVRQRSRARLLVVAVVVVSAGLLVRAVPGAPGDAGGGILYAILLFVLVAVLIPAAPAVRVGAISFAVCVAVELLQLTGLPAIAAELVPPVRYVLGSTFAASDLVAYLGGTAITVIVDRRTTRRTARRSGDRPAQ